MTRRVAAVVALIATVGAWPALDEKLQSYPSIHARETAKIKAGDAKNARYILFDAFHGLGKVASNGYQVTRTRNTGLASNTPRPRGVVGIGYRFTRTAKRRDKRRGGRDFGGGHKLKHAGDSLRAGRVHPRPLRRRPLRRGLVPVPRVRDAVV